MVSVPTYISVDVKLSDALDQINVSEAIEFYGYESVLDEIGIEQVKEYFNLVEEPSNGQ